MFSWVISFCCSSTATTASLAAQKLMWHYDDSFLRLQKLWRNSHLEESALPVGSVPSRALSFAIICAGASVQKVLLVFKHMALLVYHKPTYYYRQRHLLFPKIVGKSTKPGWLKSSNIRKLFWQAMAGMIAWGTQILHIHHLLLHSWFNSPHCVGSGIIIWLQI